MKEIERRKTALLVTAGKLNTLNAKTAHGIIRHSFRFKVLAVVDELCAGSDAGIFVDGVPRGIPVFATLGEALEKLPVRPYWCVVGIATHGGAITQELRAILREAAKKGLSIVNGLHQFVSDDPVIKAEAEKRGLEIVDVRKGKPKEELRFWNGEIYRVKAVRIAALGTDCAVGKRTTASVIVEGARSAGLKAELIYTGQTGWMLGWEYGVILDSVLNDFLPGELEGAIVRCDREKRPDLIVIEGQSALRNPCGPCGAEIILSADAKGVVLQHAPARLYFEGYEHLKLRIPPLEEEVKLISMYGAKTLCVTVNSSGMEEEKILRFCEEMSDRLGIPVIDPLRNPQKLVDVVVNYVRKEKEKREDR